MSVARTEAVRVRKCPLCGVSPMTDLSGVGLLSIECFECELRLSGKRGLAMLNEPHETAVELVQRWNRLGGAL